MTVKLRRTRSGPRLEVLEARTLLSVNGWQGYALNPQHTALSTVASTALTAIRWQAPVNLNPQYNGTDLLIHYGSPLVTASDTILIPVKTGATGGFEVQSRAGDTGTLRWNLTSDYTLMPSGGTNGYDWTPSFSPTLTPANRLYFAADGGTVEYTNAPDTPGTTPPAVTRLAFFGLANYNANPSAYNSTVFIDTPITTDASGDIFFGFLVTGSNPLGLTSGVARIGSNGTGSYVPVVSGMSQVATNSAPALSNDGSTLYVLESTGNWGSGKLVALNSQTLAVKAQVTLMDPHNTTRTAVITNDATASPTVGPDGDVYIGVLENPFASNNDRGWLLHFSGDLSTTKTPGAFGWDDTASIVPASMVPSYHGSSTYLLMTKYNNYAGEGGNGINKLAILDPNATEVDPVTGATVMKEVLTIAGVTPDPEYDGTHPGAVREWCINSAVVNPATDSILAGSEDGKLYRWNLTSNTFTQEVTLTSGIGEAYTPTLIGVNGTVYAINNATLFAVGGPSAASVGTDTTTQGNWIGAYGSQGYNVIGDTPNYPSYATVTASGNTTYQWPATTDPRALQNPGGSGRIAAVWFSKTSFTIDVNVTDGQAHDLALYLDDFDNLGRSEQIQISNATTGTVLATQSISSFSGGTYLVWQISGNVVITVTNLGPANAVVNGLFFGPPTGSASATFLRQDTTTQGSWIGAYGSQGYNVIGDTANYPSYATVTASGNTTYQWPATTDPRALQNPGGSGRIAAVWFSKTSFTIDVNVTDVRPHDLALYALDFDNLGRREQIQISDETSGAVLDTETLSSFSGGVYLVWQITGNVVITVTNLGPANAVVNGLFFDPQGGIASASFLKQDTTTQGNWIGAYGSQGYNVIGDTPNYPSYATVSASGITNYQWPATSDPRALQNPGGSGRIAAVWFSKTSFAIDVNLTDGKPHDLALYALDFDNLGRIEKIQISNATTGAVISTQTISSFSGGIYLDWKISGHVVITITNLGPANALINGLFFDPPTGSASATFLKQDTTTQGSWIGAYGSQGYNVIGDIPGYPSYATADALGSQYYQWPATTDPRALENPGGSGRIAAAWYSPTSFTIDVNLTDGLAHDLALYVLDFDSKGRREKIQISDATSGAVLDTESISSFSGGIYLDWKVSGHVVITIINQGPANALVNGLFFDPPTS